MPPLFRAISGFYGRAYEPLRQVHAPPIRNNVPHSREMRTSCVAAASKASARLAHDQGKCPRPRAEGLKIVGRFRLDHLLL